MKRYFQKRYRYKDDLSEVHPSEEGKLQRGEYFYDVIEPLLYMYKDLVDTVKPYKHQEQKDRDKFQLFSGLKNAVEGIFMVLVTPIFIISSVYSVVRFGDDTMALQRSLLKMPLLGITQMLRGVTQIATFPLTLMRIPLRLLITAKKGVPKIEDNAGIKALVSKAQKNIAQGLGESSNYLINWALKEKCIKSLRNKQTTNIEIIRRLEIRESLRLTYKDFLPAAVITALAPVSEEQPLLNGGQRII